jgi:hypothetical protein
MTTKTMNFKPALLVLLAVMLLTYACTQVEDNTRSASLLSVNQIVGEPGSEGEEDGNPLLSDTCDNANTEVQDPEFCSVFNDNASVTFANDYLQVGAGIGTNPTFLNDIMVTQYRIDYFRGNNRNTPGVDVPFGIDGTMNTRVPANGTLTDTILVVRHTAKREPPLAELDNGSSELVLTAQAQMKFFGADISGHTVSATGFLEIHFANYGETQ